MSIIIDENIENGEWPTPLAGAWAYSFYHEVTSDTVLAVFFDNDFPEGTIIEGYNVSSTIPDAYISWMVDGTCREIYVKNEYRRRGMGTALCALARTYLFNTEQKVFVAPERMTDLAKSMYESVCIKYGETYTESQALPPLLPYGYWGGYFM